VNLQLNAFDNVMVIKISGRMDTHSVPRLRQQLALTNEEAKKNVVLDLAGVDFIDSSGLSTIVHTMKQCRGRGGDLRLCKTPQAVRMVLELTRLDQTLAIFPNQEGAVLSFKPTADKPEFYAVH